MALALLTLLTGLLTLIPTTPAQAATDRPILIVGGHSSLESWMEPTWADPLATELRLPDDQVRTVELARQAVPFPPWLLWPGTDSMESSADRILLAINDLHRRYGKKIDIIAVSQGSPAARRALVKDPSAQSKVAGFISLSGANIGIPLDHPNPDWATWLENCSSGLVDWDVCEQMVYENNPGETDWLMDLNERDTNPPGDPTPGGVGEVSPPAEGISYYYIYTGRTTDIPSQDEGLTAYGWTEPLPGAFDISAQQACPSNSNRFAPHAGWYGFDTNGDGVTDVYERDAVMKELVADALNRVPLVIDNPAATCADHPQYPSG